MSGLPAVMAPRVSWCLRFRDGGDGLEASLDAADRMPMGEWEILVVHRADVTAKERQALDRLARRGARLVAGAGSEAGDLAAALEAARGELLLLSEPGDLPEPPLARRLTDLLADPRRFAWSLVGTRHLAADRTAEIRRPPSRPDGAALLRRPWLVDVVALSVPGAREVGGVDPSTGPLALVDLLARLPAGTSIEEPLVVRPPSLPPVGDRDGWRRGRHALLAKHDGAFADLPRLLGDVEEAIRDQSARVEPRRAARRELVEEMDALREEIAALRLDLAADGRDALDWGDLRSVAPVDRDWGYSRGGPVDRVYIEEFLGRHASDIRGVVLEVQEPDYAHRFGGPRLAEIDVVDIDPANPRATVVADLRDAVALPTGRYDAVILTQTVHVIDDMGAVMREMARILRPGGVLLATFPAASRVCVEYGPDGDFWRATEAGVRALATAAFPADAVAVESLGNVLATTAFLQGVGRTELSPAELAVVDPYHPTVIGLRAVRPRQEIAPDPRPGRRRLARRPEPRCAILAWHRIASPPSSDVHRLVVSPELFREQLERTTRRVAVRPLADIVEAVRARRPPDGVVALTFDDGYEDMVTHAVPILRSIGLPATFFVTAGGLDAPVPFWWDRLEAILLGEGRRSATLDLELPEGRRIHLPTGSPKARRGAHDAIHRAARGMESSERERLMNRLREWAGVDLSALPRPMTAQEAAWIARDERFRLEAHGVDHLSLPAVPPEAMDREVVAGRRRLGDLLGRAPEAFAYPYGDLSERAVAAVRRAGFGAGLSCRGALVHPDDDPFRLPRIEVPSDGGEAFERFLDRWFGEREEGSA